MGFEICLYFIDLLSFEYKPNLLTISYYSRILMDSVLCVGIFDYLNLPLKEKKENKRKKKGIVSTKRNV